MNSFSVGFRPLAIKGEPFILDGEQRQGLVFTKAELVEYSAVPVPANPGATVSRELGDILLKDGLPGLWLKGEADGYRLSSISDVIAAELSKPDLQDMEHFDATMKYLQELCKMEKGKQTLSKDRLALAKNATTALTELIAFYQGEPTPDQIAEIRASVEQLAKTVQQIYGDPRGTARKLVQAFNRSF